MATIMMRDDEGDVIIRLSADEFEACFGCDAEDVTPKPGLLASIEVPNKPGLIQTLMSAAKRVETAAASLEVATNDKASA